MKSSYKILLGVVGLASAQTYDNRPSLQTPQSLKAMGASHGLAGQFLVGALALRDGVLQASHALPSRLDLQR